MSAKTEEAGAEVAEEADREAEALEGKGKLFNC